MTIAYLRVSTGKQHLENQKEEIEKFAARKNLTVNRWVTEVVSGKKKEHDRKLGRLLKSLKRGDVLIVTELHWQQICIHQRMQKENLLQSQFPDLLVL